MAIFRKVHIQFWGDAFIQSLTPEQKFFFLYLLTNERTKQCGIYEITTRQISYDTGYNIETINILLDFFSEANKILFSRDTNEIAIKNWDKYNSSRSPDVQNLVNKEVALIKNKKLIEWVQSGNRVVTHTEKSLREEPEPEREPEREIDIEEVGSEKISQIANLVWKDQKWKENICPGLNISVMELKQWLALFNSSICGAKINGFDKATYMRMSRGWIASKLDKGEKVNIGISKKSDSAPLKILPSGI